MQQTHTVTQKLFFDTHFFEITKTSKMALQSALPAAVNSVWSLLRHTRFLLLTFQPPLYPPICQWFCLSFNSSNNRPCWLSLAHTVTFLPAFGKADTGRTRRSQVHCTALVLAAIVTALTLIYIPFDISIEGIVTLSFSDTSALCSFDC